MTNFLGQISIRNTEMTTDPHGFDMLHVSDPHALIQASGYLKFIRGRSQEGIFFRGQSKTYPTLSPSLFRGIGSKQSEQVKRVVELRKQLERIAKDSKLFASFSIAAHEPLLQHYGLSTTWLDLVDNIWVALWFSVHEARTSGKPAKYLHFERRAAGAGQYAYILLVAADSQQTSEVGFYRGAETELVDLRTAAPSIFLRPHAQHGVLFRKRGKGTARPIDYADQIRGIIRIDLSDALDWLGEAKTLSTHALFPPPYYDHGYKVLLNGDFDSNSLVGSVQIVGA